MIEDAENDDDDDEADTAEGEEAVADEEERITTERKRPPCNNTKLLRLGVSQTQEKGGVHITWSTFLVADSPHICAAVVYAVGLWTCPWRDRSAGSRPGQCV